MKKVIIPLSIIAALVVIYTIVIPAFTGRLFISPQVSLGFLQIRWYGLILAASVLLGYFVSRKYSWRFGIAPTEIDNFSFWLILVSFVGARLYFILFAFDFFKVHPEEILRVWHGGLSIYGALISGTVFTWIWSYNKAYSFRHLIDVVAMGLPLAQALGRWGNFVNNEAFGAPTSFYWKMFVQEYNRPRGLENYEFFHPTFLYESLAMIAVFFIIQTFVGKGKAGVIGFLYLGLYSLVRFFIEPLRVDSVWVYDFRADQIVSLIVILISGIIILRWQFGLGQKVSVEKT